MTDPNKVRYPSFVSKQSDGSNIPAEAFGTGEVREFLAGDVIFSSGQKADEVFFLQRGKIRLVLDTDTPQTPSQVFGPGVFFGESGMVKGRLRRGTAVALVDGALRVFAYSRLHEYLSNEPELAVRLVLHLASTLEELRDQAELLSVEDRRTRIILALARLAREYASSEGVGDVNHAALPVSPLDLSKLIGVDVDSVKAVVRELREAGHLRVNNGLVEVNDIDSLRTLTDLLELRDRISGGQSQRRAMRIRRSD